MYSVMVKNGCTERKFFIKLFEKIAKNVILCSTSVQIAFMKSIHEVSDSGEFWKLRNNYSTCPGFK